MRILLVGVLLLGLNGCAMIDAYFMAHFDSNEYLLVDEIKSLAEVSPASCSDRDKMNSIVGNLYLTATKLKNYSIYIPRNEKTIPLTESLYDEVYKLQTRYQNPDKISVVYCKMKLNIIEKSADTIQEVVGSKPR